jgi:hypothetical protein
MSDENTCIVCKEKFNDEEYKLTNDKNKCILHCDNKEKDLDLFIKSLDEIQNKDYKEIIFPENYSFNEAFFSGETYQFTDCIFYNNIRIEMFENIEKLYFNHSIFKKSMVIKKDLKNFSLLNCISEDRIYILVCKIDILTIHFSYFNYASFSKLNIKKISLRGSSFKNNFHFFEVKNFENQDLEYRNIKDRETARIIKDSFEKQNNIIEANRFYNLEMIANEKELRKIKNETSFFSKERFDWLVFKIHGLSSNHSQNWLLALFWIFVIGIFTSLFDFYTVEINNIYAHASFWSIFGTLIFLFLILFCFYSYNLFQALLLYIFYIYKTEDYTLYYVVQVINPFQKIIDVNIIDFLSKVIIAYLIYQFVISIRQNTRRK